MNRSTMTTSRHTPSRQPCFSYVPTSRNPSDAMRARLAKFSGKTRETNFQNPARSAKGSGFVGDELRGRRNPSVSDLLSKRATEMDTNWADDTGLVAAGPAEAGASLVDGRTERADCCCAAATGRQGGCGPDPATRNLQALSRKLFMEPGAPMSPSSMVTAGRSPGDLIRSPLLIERVFRESVPAGSPA